MFSMDLSQEGLLMFFKPYQLKALQTLWVTKEGMNTRQIWEAVGSDKISRASIINFLESAYNDGLLNKSEITGKGGHRGIYTARYDEAETKQYLRNLFIERLNRL